MRMKVAGAALSASLVLGVSVLPGRAAAAGTATGTAAGPAATGTAVGGSTTVTARSGEGPVTTGYWEVSADGLVSQFGEATNYTPVPPPVLNRPIVGATRAPDGNGYWLVASDGGIFGYGDATFYGSTGGITLNKPVVGMAATPDGHGYWLVASDGGIFSYGDATFYGSTGGITLDKPVVGMAATPDGQGYWLVASDGGIFSYGDATFHGSTGGTQLTAPVVGMAPSATGQGYYLVASDGGIFNYGAAEFDGSASYPAPYQYPFPTVGMMVEPPTPVAVAAGTPFAGFRYHHGIYLTVGDDGRFSVSYRTYNNIDYPETHTCGYPEGCDLFTANSLIIDGGHAGGRITSISGNSASVAIGYDPGGVLGGATAMTYDPSTDEVSFNGVTFCGTQSPTVNDCGA